MLTDEQIRQFREDGYLVFAALILPEELNPERFLKGIYEDRHVACKH